MGRGDLAKVRNSKDRAAEEEGARQAAQAAERGEGAEGREEEVAWPAPPLLSGTEPVPERADPLRRRARSRAPGHSRRRRVALGAPEGAERERVAALEGRRSATLR